jgi:hypothetical protein
MPHGHAVQADAEHQVGVVHQCVSILHVSIIYFSSLQGDLIGNFSPVGLLLEAHCDFKWKDEVAQRQCSIMSYFLFKHFFIYHPNKQFQNMVCYRYVNVSKVVCHRYFGLSN